MASVDDAYDNALAESFVDSLKTELIADRGLRSRTQLELGLVQYISWFNNDRLRESLATSRRSSSRPFKPSLRRGGDHHEHADHDR